jgi:hypothetical protein
VLDKLFAFLYSVAYGFIIRPLMAAVCLLFTSSKAQSPIGEWKFQEGSSSHAADKKRSHSANLVNGVIRVEAPVEKGVKAARRRYVAVPPGDLTHATAVTVTMWLNRTSLTAGSITLLEALDDYQCSLSLLCCNRGGFHLTNPLPSCRFSRSETYAYLFLASRSPIFSTL